MKTPGGRRWRALSVNFEHMSHLFFISIVDFEQINVSRVFAEKSRQLLFAYHL